MEKDRTKLKIEDIVELANHGNAEAEYELGYRFYNGLDVEQNRSEARKWFLKASGKGIADAALAAAETYYWGRGVRRDREKSQWFFLEACSCFDRDYKSGRQAGYSAFRIYEILYGGYLGKKYVETADVWLQRAMDAKYAEAFCELARRYFMGEEIEEDEEKSAALYEQAIALLDPETDQNTIYRIEEAIGELRRQ